jgi:hypothetical protein
MKKILAALAIGVAIILVVFLAIPMPSFQRSLVLTNQLPTGIEILCKTGDGKREKTVRLSPGEQLKFVYFSGDHDGRATIPVSVEVKNLTDGRTTKRQLDLPTGTQPPGIGVSEEWFAPKKE